MVAMHIVCPNCDTINRVNTDQLSTKALCGKCKQPLFNGHPAELSNQNIDRHITRNDIPVVIDFWAPWCGPCKMMAPAYQQATEQLEPHFRLVKVNTEKEQVLANKYSIRSIPTLIYFNNGKEIARQSGALSVTDLLTWIRNLKT